MAITEFSNQGGLICQKFCSLVLKPHAWKYFALFLPLREDVFVLTLILVEDADMKNYVLVINFPVESDRDCILQFH